VHRRLLIVAVVLAAAVAAAVAWPQDEDRPVNPARADARAAAQRALAIVPGRVAAVTFDIDDDKWEVIVARENGEYEIELTPGDYRLLRLDYD
jgi:hypothetical protein